MQGHKAYTSEEVLSFGLLSPTDETIHSSSSLHDSRDGSWMKQPLEIFTDKLTVADSHLPRKVRNFYKKQNQLIRDFQEVDEKLHVDNWNEDQSKYRLHALKISKRLSVLMLLCNVLLITGKSVAAFRSGSLSIISSLVDSGIDILSGIILWYTSRIIVKRNPYTYPQGRTRLEPIAIIVLSALMASGSLQIFRESITRIISMANNADVKLEIDYLTLGVVIFNVLLKLALLITCLIFGRRHKKQTKTILIMAQDHRNDVLTNTVVLICTVLTKYYEPLKYSDPVGAIAVAIFILIGWYQTGKEHIRWLSGITAEPNIIQKLTFISLNHDKQIKGIDTVRAFYHGSNLFVEIDIILPGSMRLREAHDIGESLQVKLESLEEVERAFVHLDYESQHDPRSEHKQV